jgi:hypothetical protein
MTADTPPDPATPRAGTARVAPDPSARDRLPDADYADAFRVPADGSVAAGAWARRAFEAGPPVVGRIFRAVAWRGLLGMDLGPEGSPAHVAGWTVVVDEPRVLVMHVDSWMLTARLVTETTPTGTTMTTLLRFDRPAGRVAWAAGGPVHRALMPGVLTGAARSLARDAPRAPR